MASSNPPAPDNQPTFDFYSGFLTVVYGLLVSNGLEEAVKFGGNDPVEQLESVHGLQFLATFALALHFWFAFATLGQTADEFDEAFTSPRAAIFNFPVLVDVLVATVVGFLLLEMFGTVSNEKFYLWFLLTSVISLLYDGYCRVLMWWAPLWAAWRHRQQIKSSILEGYRRRINRWMIRDVCFLTTSGAVYLMHRHYSVSEPLLYGIASLCIVVLVLLMDLGSVRPLRVRRWRSL